MRRRQVFGLVLLVGVALVGLGLWYAARTLTSGLCSNTVVQVVVSPDATHQALLFARNCGATTGTSTHVSIINAGEQLPNEPGNVFIAELDQPGKAAPWGGPWADLVWSDANTLMVRHARLARVAKAEQQVAGERVAFRPAEPGFGAGRGGSPPDSRP